MTKKTKCLKTTVAVLSVVLVMCLTVAGTLAWLFDETTPVVNTFSPSDIGLTLQETTGDTYKMVPGVDRDKNPTVTVSGDVDTYVFVKIVEAGSVTVVETVDGTEVETTYTFDDFLTYAIADGWTVLEGTFDTNDSTNGNETVVIHRTVAADATNKSFSVLAGDKVTTNTGVTKQMMNAYTDNSIKLTFTAYAIQKDGFENNVTGAWTAAQGLQNS